MDRPIEGLRALQEERNQTLEAWLKVYADWQLPDDMPIEKIEGLQDRYRQQTDQLLKDYGPYLDKHGNVFMASLDRQEDVAQLYQIEKSRAQLLESISQENQRCMKALDDYKKELSGQHQTFKQEAKDSQGYAKQNLDDARFVDKKI